nr:inorganic polyphosphate kinase [Clostridium amazonitimonense]
MKDYNKTEWKDHIVDMDSGEVVQEGTPVSARIMNNIEEGIFGVTVETSKNSADITSLAIEVAILKNASLNNLTNNVFFENFDTLNSVKLENGIYDPVAKKVYV